MEIINTSFEAAIRPERWHNTLDLIVETHQSRLTTLTVLDEHYKACVLYGCFKMLPNNITSKLGYKLGLNLIIVDSNSNPIIRYLIVQNNENCCSNQNKNFN